MLNEKCVICGNDSGVAKDTPIQDRERYVKGSGQLCRECWFELYLKPNSESPAAVNAEMERLLEISRKP